MDNEAIIILGMHRSGTSATTGMLNCLGVTLGKNLYAGHENINAKGYFEHSGLANNNEEALLAINSAWDDILPKDPDWWKNEELAHYAQKIEHYFQTDFSKATVWAIKDPRFCRLLPWWLEILNTHRINSKFVIVIRPPHEVYLSLKKRDGFSLEKSYLLWLLHYLDAEYWTRGMPRAFVTFESLVNNPVATFSNIEQSLDLRFPISPEQASESLSQFISKDLIHHSEQLPDNSNPIKLVELALDLHTRLSTVAENSQIHPGFEQMDAIRMQVNDIQQSFCPLLIEHIRQTNKIRSSLQLTMNKVLRSKSWVFYKPLRFLERRIIGRDV
jgi:hypothetical protein